MIDWISVKERLPEELNKDCSRKVVLTYDIYGKIRDAFILCKIFHFLDDDGYGHPNRRVEVTHWAKINEPAKYQCLECKTAIDVSYLLNNGNWCKDCRK